ncbi:MAG TPA: hypothetical protein VF014_02395 [Casimicrobiaceae bacterium]|nr:hypothetical protein [Casimicrobiaceae bacterium]
MVSRRHPGSQAHVGEGAIDEIAHSYQATVQHGARRAREPYIAGFDGGDGESRGIDEVAELVGQKAQSFIKRLTPFIGNRKVALVGKFGDGIGDRVVQATVESPKFVDLDWRIVFECHVRYSLAEIAVIMNNLVNREPVLQQVVPVPRRSYAHLGQNLRSAARWAGDLATLHGLGRLFDLERLDKLLEEEWYSVFELRIGRLGRGPLSDLYPASIDQCSPLGSKEFMQHWPLSTLLHTSL